MSYKQKRQKYSPLNSQQPPKRQEYQQRVAELPPTQQRKLVQMWEQQNVNDSYQSIVLKYFDQLKGRQLQKEITAELQHMYHRSSFYHKIQSLLVERQKSLDQLEECCQEMRDIVDGKDEESYDLERVCDYVDHVRKTGMCICENVWEMFEYFKYKPHNKNTMLDGKYYITMLAGFDSDLRFLKQSLLRYYIPFSNDFDPLLVESGKPLRRYYGQNKIVYNRHVDELFRLNASYLYRLLRAHQRIISYYMLSKDLQNIEEENLFESQNYQYESPSHSSNSKLEKKQSLVVYRVKKPETEIRRRRVPMMEKQQLVGHVLTDDYPPTLSAQQHNQPKVLMGSRDRRDNRKITRIAEITINHSNKSLRPHQRNQEDKLEEDYKQEEENQEQSMPQKLVETQQSEKQKASTINPQRIITEAVQLRKSKPSSRNDTISNNASSMRHPRPYLQSNSLDKEQSSSIRKDTAVENTPQFKRKRSKTTHLPKLPQKDLQHQHHDETSDCQCRQKYKSRKMKQSNVDMSVGQIEERRQTIIKKINQKYRDLAKKQIRFELSMLGDLTYHKMKDKIKQSRLKVKQQKVAERNSQKYLLSKD